MYYAIRHITRFRYSAPVSESVMEVRMQPRSEGNQRCLNFRLHTTPRTRPQSHTDYLANIIHHFDVPSRHSALTITAEALVEVRSMPILPEALGFDAWDAINQLLNDDHDAWDMVQPSSFARPSEALYNFANELGLNRNADPLTTLRWLNSTIYKTFAYAPQTTRVDSPIEEAIRARKGVCQDFAHIMIALVRNLGIPCRYVSGYLFHRNEDRDRSEVDATHAWVEALLPELGWVGFDPTNDLIASERHIRTAIGRDYDDVPPTRGTFKGGATSELQVSVRVAPSEAPPPMTTTTSGEELNQAEWGADQNETDPANQQQQQQQQ